jgi:hypothetical protein
MVHKKLILSLILGASLIFVASGKRHKEHNRDKNYCNHHNHRNSYRKHESHHHHYDKDDDRKHKRDRDYDLDDMLDDYFEED